MSPEFVPPPRPALALLDETLPSCIAAAAAAAFPSLAVVRAGAPLGDCSPESFAGRFGCGSPRPSVAVSALSLAAAASFSSALWLCCGAALFDLRPPRAEVVLALVFAVLAW
jgi:hypothetical protein